MEQGSSESLDNSANVPVTSEPVNSEPAERVFKQSEVNDLIGRAKSDAVDRFRRETSKASHQEPQRVSEQTSHQPDMRDMSSGYGMSQNEVRKLAGEEAQRLRDEWIEDSTRSAQQNDAQRIAQEFFGKLETVKSKYSDYDSAMSNMDFGAIPQIVQAANMMENTGDIMYELAKNPSKIGTVQQLLQISPKLAMVEMKKLSDSIKNNSEASNFQHANDPLSQVTPSNAGMDSKGDSTVASYKKRYKG